MSSMTESSVVRRLEGQDCQWCTDGRLERGRYKGNVAVICEDCDTPAAQLW